MQIDVNKINWKYFSRGEQLDFFKDKYLELLSPEKKLFPKHITDNDLVLDLGCGAGRTTLPIHKLAKKVIGTDISQPLIDMANEKYPDIEFRVMDASNIDYPDNYFDVVVFSYNGICYLYPEEKRNASIKEIHRVLKHNGKIIFSSFNRYPPYTLSSTLNIIVTKILMGFKTKYKIHLTRYGVTINYETSPEQEIKLWQEMNFQLDEMVSMTERVGFFGYTPEIATYYVFKKL